MAALSFRQAAASLLLLLFASIARADDWQAIKRYLQPQVRIVQEDAERLVLALPSASSERPLIITREREADSDLFAALAQRRGGNPYRIWVASEQLWQDPKRPRSQWGRYLRSEFWSVVRAPRQELAR